jgi:hypothetical protein
MVATTSDAWLERQRESQVREEYIQMLQQAQRYYPTIYIRISAI